MFVYIGARSACNIYVEPANGVSITRAINYLKLTAYWLTAEMAMFVPGMPGDQWANKRWEKTRLLILAIDAMQISYTTTCAIVEGLEAVGGGGGERDTL